VLDDAFRHLSSRNPLQFWTSGQWMTERKGGSDVGLYVWLLLLLQQLFHTHYVVYGFICVMCISFYSTAFTTFS